MFIINPYIFSSGGYTIEQSAWFDGSDDDLTIEWSTTPTSVKTGTVSLWLKQGEISARQSFIGMNNNTSNQLLCHVESDNAFRFNWIVGGTTYLWKSNALLRDPTAWGNLTFNWTAASNTFNAWWNGVALTWASSATLPDADLPFASADDFLVGAEYNGGSKGERWNGYLAEVVYIDGTALAPSSNFGETNDDTGIFTPVDPSGLTFGNNGIYLKFANASSLGVDSSGNGRNFTVNGSMAAAQQVEDSSTNDADNNIGNYATLNPLVPSGVTITKGNLEYQTESSALRLALSSIQLPTTGKIYTELTLTVQFACHLGLKFIENGVEASHDLFYAQAGTSTNRNSILFGYNNAASPYPAMMIIADESSSQTLGESTTLFSALSQGDVLMQAYDIDSGKVFYGLNGTWYNSGDPAAGSNPSTTVGSPQNTYPAFICVNSMSAAHDATINFGQKAFAHTIPTGFTGLSTANLTTPTISKPTDYFAPFGYTGNATDDTAIAVGFQPDFTLIKNRDQADPWKLIDSLRGATKNLGINAVAENTEAAGLKAFTSTGFTLGTGASGYNDNSEKFVSYNWLAGGAPTADNTNAAGAAPVSGSVMVNGSANTDNLVGTKAALRISANTSSGFAIVRWDSSANAAVTIDHKLGKVPKMYWVKTVDQDYGWYVYHQGIGNTHYLLLHDEANPADNVYWNDTTPTSTVFSVNSASALEGVNHTGKDFIAYLWADVEGFSKFGTYTGNGDHDGPFIYTGFKPSMFFIKRTDTAVRQWNVYDDQRDTYNPADYRYWFDAATANASNGEGLIDFLSNGVKIRDDQDWLNANNSVYIFAAWARSPFASNNRAR